MPCCAQALPHSHREKESDFPFPVELLQPPEEEGLSFRIPAAVTKLLDYRETRSDPRAILAVRTEMEALADVGTWDESTVMEKDQLKEFVRTLLSGRASGYAVSRTQNRPLTNSAGKADSASAPLQLATSLVR